MTKEEIVRRLRALLATKPEERPIKVERLAHVAGLSLRGLRHIAAEGTMQDASRVRLARALTWVENDQVVVKKTPNRPTVVTIRPPQPPQENVLAVDLTKDGPKVRIKAVNPRTFPRRV
jgi:hypothetical protein